LFVRCGFASASCAQTDGSDDPLRDYQKTVALTPAPDSQDEELRCVEAMGRVCNVRRDPAACCDAVDKRFEAMDKRFEALTQRVDRFLIWSFTLTLSVGALIVAALKLWP